MKIVIVQIRGMLKVKPKVKKTIRVFNLPKKHSCVLVDNTNETKGMLHVLKDYVTWGEADLDTVKLLLEKRGKIVGGKKLEESYLKDKIKLGFDGFAKELVEGKKKMKDVPGLKPFFRLNPPKGGFERKGIKQPFSLGGVLGYRSKKIKDLIERMV